MLDTVKRIAQNAGEGIMEVYATDFTVNHKTDHSPVTAADMAAHEIIKAGLTEIQPNLPILSEESTAIPYDERASWKRYWLVDPLDGTREFVKRNGEFTVNIALIDDHKPILGVIYVPVTKVTYVAIKGEGAFKYLPNGSKEQIQIRSCPKDHIVIAASRSHINSATKKFIENLDTQVKFFSVGSSLKSCLVAEGKVDIYPRFGPTSEWDTAAAQCIVEEAGGVLTDLNLKPLRYNTKESLLNPHFIVCGDSNLRLNKLI
jgi:3'(2'), 5'-bisphosphate nucleotidase